MVQPVRVESSYLIAELSVGFAEAQIESPTVGGKFAYVSFQMSHTAEPDTSASNVTLVIVLVLGARTYVIMPGVMTAPLPANTAV